jgi:hypothetical protein
MNVLVVMTGESGSMESGRWKGDRVCGVPSFGQVSSTSMPPQFPPFAHHNGSVWRPPVMYGIR